MHKNIQSRESSSTSLYLFIHRLPCGNINDTPVYSRVKCYSSFPCACGFIHGFRSLSRVKLLRLFLFSLLGRAKQWFYANKADVDTWDKCAIVFLSKFFPTSKANALRGQISYFQQASNESISEAWERLQEYILACPHPGMDNWLIL